MPRLTCPVCDTEFYRSPAGLIGIKNPTCSLKCQLTLRIEKPTTGAPPITLTCSVCQKEFKRDAYGVRVSKTYYCSRQCFRERKNRAGYIDSQGYRVISVNNKRIREHRYVMEQHLDRKLRPGEVIHHKNGDKLDNRLDNLELTTLEAHTSHHHTGRVVSESARKKSGDARRGQVISQEQRQKISESLKRYFANHTHWRHR